MPLFKLHPSRFRLISVIATTGSPLVVLRQICDALDADSRSHSIARLTRIIKTQFQEIAQRKQTFVLVIEEAGLLRLEVFS